MFILALLEKKCSAYAWHFGILFISYMFQEKGFHFDYFHHIEGDRSSVLKNKIPKPIPDIGVIQRKNVKTGQGKSLMQTILQPKYFEPQATGTVTNKQKNEMSTS